MRYSAEKMDDEESDVPVCPGLLMNFVSAGKLFVEIDLSAHLLFSGMFSFPSILMAAERALAFLQHDSSPLTQSIGPAVDS